MSGAGGVDAPTEILVQTQQPAEFRSSADRRPEVLEDRGKSRTELVKHSFGIAEWRGVVLIGFCVDAWGQ